MDRAQLADFLRRRRQALQPEDVGLARGPRRRTGGLRREEVAALVGMSADYYARLEQRRGPQPSEPMLAAIARGLRLTRDERDHLFRLAGHTAPPRTRRNTHVAPALMRVLDRLDTPAQVITDAGETLAQNHLADALLGNQTALTGYARNAIYRWFTDAEERRIYPAEDHDRHTRSYVAVLRAALTRYPDDPGPSALAALLRRESEEFADYWGRHEVAGCISGRRRMIHPSVGEIELDCQALMVENDAQILVVYTATPGSEGRDKLQLLSIVGAQGFDRNARQERHERR